MDITIFFHNLPVFTLWQFIQTWGIYSIVALILFGTSTRTTRTVAWLAMWIALTPERSIGEDFVWMACCWLLTELIYLKIQYYFKKRRQSYASCH